MRVIAGEAKGHEIKVPNKSSIRPTTGLVRGAIFSILESMIDDWSLALDLYAGTGALGIEALSRGTEWVDFVEQNSRHCSTIEVNLRHTGFIDRSRVYCSSAAKAIASLDKRYNVVFIDPPYLDVDLDDILGKLFASNLVGDCSVVALQHSYHQQAHSTYSDFFLAKTRKYGDTQVSIYQQGEALCR